MTHIGRFEIEKKLGIGGMAVVYLCREKELERQVAIKLMSREMAQVGDHRERFLKEARACAALSHPAVVPIYEVGEVSVDETESAPRPYFAMAYMGGGDLRDKIREGLSDDRIVDIALSVIGALSHAHSRGFVHRDVKPGNILFDDNGEVFLTDFGIVKNLEQDEELTVVGTMVGTPTYMSPEQCRGMTVDGRSDIYALGCVLFEMLSGSRPYPMKDPLALLAAHDSSPVPKLAEERSHWQGLIEKCMAKSPDDRFASGVELRNALLGMRDGTMTSIAPPSTTAPVDPTEAPERNSLFGKKAAIALSAVLVAGLMATLFLMTGNEAEQLNQNQSETSERAESQASDGSILGTAPASPAQNNAAGQGGNAAAVDRAMEFVDRYNGTGQWLDARNQVSSATAKSISALSVVLRDTEMSQEEMAAAYSDTILSIVQSENLAVPLERLFEFHDQQLICREMQLCDGEVAARFFDNDAGGFVRTFYPWVCQIRADWGNPAAFERVLNYYLGDASATVCEQ